MRDFRAEVQTRCANIVNAEKQGEAAGKAAEEARAQQAKVAHELQQPKQI